LKNICDGGDVEKSRAEFLGGKTKLDKDYEKALADAEEIYSRHYRIDRGMSLRSPELDEAARFHLPSTSHFPPRSQKKP
jgi:hypothetical protein